MDQKTANLVALIKSGTLAALSLIAVVSMVALAWVHDGAYAQLAQSALPELLFGSGGLLVALHIVDSVAATSVANHNTDASVATAAAAAAVAAQPAEPAPAVVPTEAAPPEPAPASAPTTALSPAPDGGPLIGQ